MASGDPFASTDAFDDWLTHPLDPLASGASFDDSLASLFAQDPLSNLSASHDKLNNHSSAGIDPLEGVFGATGGGGGADHTTVGTGEGGHSEGSSPAQSRAYGYASSSAAGDTSLASLTTSGTTAPSSTSEMDSFFSSGMSAHAASPAFSFGTVEELAANLPPTFDASALQSLFADPPPAATSASSSHNGLSPFSAASVPLQTLSPAPTVAASTSPYSPAVNTFFTSPAHGIFLSTPSASSGASSGASSTASPPQQHQGGMAIPRLSVDFGAPPPPASSAPSMTFGAFQAAQQQQQFAAAAAAAASRPRTSLAATAGVTLPPSLLLHPTHAPHPHGIANSNQTPAGLSYTLRSDPSAPLPLAMLQAQAQEYAHAQVQQQGSGQGVGMAQGRATRRTATAAAAKTQDRSAVEVLANAGIQGSGVYQAPLLQLRPDATFPPFDESLPSTGAAAAPVKHEEKEDVSPPPAPAPATKGGRGAKGKAAAAAASAASKKEKDKGHNAVEQKYRNSINNALATLRDEIPALQHLKPLPSMPASRRKASQFTLAPAAVPTTPHGLVDGILAAKTLSKGTILQKAIEYIVFLRSARDGLEEDLQMFREMVEGAVQGGEGLVREFERRREVQERRREAEREKRREMEENEGEDDDEDDDEATAPVAPAAAKGKKAAPAASSKKRGAPSTAPTAAAKKARLPSQHISPPLTSEYQRVQALNAAHLEALAAQQQQQADHHQQQGQHTFPPSPASSGEGVSPSAIMGGGANGHSPPRVLFASFMGLSFAGGTAYDWTTSAATAEEAVAGSVARAWTARLVRRSATLEAAAAGAGLADLLLHPSLLGGLVAVGLASIVVSLLWLVYPLFSSLRRPSSSSSSPPSFTSDSPSHSSRKRDEALAALAALNAPKADGSEEPETHAAAREKALQARKELLKLVGAPGAVGAVFAMAKEAVVAAVREGAGVTVSRARGGSGAREREEAVAWVRVAEIEASFADRIPYLARCYTFLRLSNLSHSSSWPSTAPSPSTSRPAVDALLALHLLTLGHPRWAEVLWNRMLLSSKKADGAAAAAASSFVDLAVSSDFATVQALLDPAARSANAKDDAAPAAPSDTVPLLVLAEATCEDALRDVWQKLFVGVAASTTAPGAVTASPLEVYELRETIDNVARSSVEGSEVHALAAMSQVFLACFLAGTSNGGGGGDSSAAAASMRDTFLRLALEFRHSSSSSPFARLAAARPFLHLFLPVFSPSSSFTVLFPPSSSGDEASPLEPTTEVDLLASATLEWLLVRKAGAAALFVVEQQQHEGDESEAQQEEVKVDPALHARALAVRRLLGHDLFLAPSPSEEDVVELSAEEKAAALAMEDAKDALVDALTRVARRAAGLKGGLWEGEDSGVELEA
ncbi:hypothetical protein JCM6882_005984 [Rhodosporidiobolus microsporus]